MYEKNSTFVPLKKNDKIWRYLDFTKFISLLNKEALYFRRSDKLEDPFEGSLPLPNFLLRNRELTYDFPKANQSELIREISLDAEVFKKLIFINCWHISKHESAAMWKAYLKSEEGVAIQSTFHRLIESFSIDREYIQYIGKVSYIDYDSEKARPHNNAYAPFLHKRKSFEYEKELRVLLKPPIYEIGQGEVRELFGVRNIEKWQNTGFEIRVDLDKLIDRIYVSPKAEDWFKKVVESVLTRYNLNKEVIRSSLADESPLY